jgi:hypothetical protein
MDGWHWDDIRQKARPRPNRSVDVTKKERWSRQYSRENLDIAHLLELEIHRTILPEGIAQLQMN